MWATPRTGESGVVNVEFGLTQSTGAYSSTRVGNLLDDSFRSDEVINLGTEGSIFAAGENVNDSLVNEGRISSPGEKVWGISLARTGDNNTRLEDRNNGFRAYFGTTITDMHTFAFSALEPPPPILANRPVFEIGPCDAMYESTELDCAKTEPTKTANEIQERRIFQKEQEIES